MGKNILEQLEHHEVKKLYKSEKDFEDFYKWIKSYDKTVKRETVIKKFTQITGIKVKPLKNK